MDTFLVKITNYLWCQSWQLALLIVVIVAISWALRNRSAHIRYLLWLIVLVKCLVPPFMTVPVAILPPDKSIEQFQPPPIAEPPITLEASDVGKSVPTMTPVTSIEKNTEQSKASRLVVPSVHQLAGAVWILGIMIFACVAIARAARSSLRLREQRRPLPSELQISVDELLSSLETKVCPRVWLLDGLGQPFVWGLFRGSIYLPADYLKIDTAAHRRDILGHEVCHVLRLDAAVNLLQIVAQAIFWFHPFVWWANQKIRMEREKCCDEMVVAHLGAKVKEYSTAIVKALVTEHESNRPVPSLAVAGSVKDIEERIRTMLKPGKKFYQRPSLIAAAVVLLMAVLTAPTTLVLTTRAESETRTESAHAVPIFGNPVNLGSKVNSSANEKDPHISANGLSLYFVSKGPGGNFDIWATTRKTKDDPWSTPVNLGPTINSFAREDAPCLSADGLEMYFVSDRPGGSGSRDIWVTTRKTKDSPWGSPVNLGPKVNTSVNENHPSISTDGLTLYFSGDFMSMPRQPGGLGDSDIWVTRRQTRNEPWGIPINLGASVNSPVSDVAPCISSNGLHLYFVSARLGGLGSNDIWVTTRKTKEDLWGTPVNLGPTVNSPYDVYCPDISSDGSTLYFATDPPGNVFGRYSMDIWQVSLTPDASSLQSAAFAGDLAKVEAFLDARVDVNHKNNWRMTALYSAASGGHNKVVEFLLAHGANVNERNAPNTYLTALFAAVLRGHKEIVEVLLAKGADVHLRAGGYYYRRTVAEMAMECNHNEIVKLLMARGADISALHFAIHMQDYAKARELINSGTDVNQRIPRLGTLLHLAVKSDQEDVVELLIAKDVDVNIQAGHGYQTPLHISVHEGNARTVELLVAKGADINAKNLWDRTPLDIALDQGRTEIVDLLRKHGAKE